MISNKEINTLIEIAKKSNEHIKIAFFADKDGMWNIYAYAKKGWDCPKIKNAKAGDTIGDLVLVRKEDLLTESQAHVIDNMCIWHCMKNKGIEKKDLKDMRIGLKKIFKLAQKEKT
jgi:hypothetical protein